MHEPAASPLVLTIVYWLHMLATVVWIGGLAALSFIVLPAARKTLDAPAYAAFFGQLRGRMQTVGWFSLLVLGGTGMFQMSANRNYNGFLAIDNPWATAILAKHILIGVMILVSIYVTWGVLPALQRTALMRAAGRSVDEKKLASLQAREVLLLRANLALSFIVLLLTAWARSAS